MLSSRLRFLAASTLALSSLFGISVGVVSAHAQYAGSTPSANATVQSAPSVVLITFTQELADIRIAITGPDGSEVTTAPAKFNLAQRRNASVPTRDAGPGLYTVVWHNVSGDDGDPNDGSFVFTVAGAAPSTAAPSPAQPSTSTQAQAPAAAAPTCIDNGVRTPGINDVRVDTYCKRQAIRDTFAGKIVVVTFNEALADGEGLESALADAMADFQMQQQQKKK